MRTSVIAAIRLLQFYITGLAFPILSLLFLDRGLTLSQLALSFGFYSATTILCEVPTGVIADLLGRKKTYQLSIVAYVIAFGVIFAGRSFWVLSIGNIFYGVSRALASGSIDALFIDDYTKTHGADKLPRIMTIFTVTEALGLALGALSGGYLPVFSSAHFHRIGKYDLNIIVKIVLLIVLFILVSTLVHEQKGRQESKLKAHLSESFSVVKNSRNLKLIFIVLIATGVFLSALELFWQPRFESLMQNKSMTWLLGIIAMLYFGAVILGGLVAGKAAKRFTVSYKWIYFASKLLTGFMLVLLAMQSGIWGFTAFYVMTYLFFGASHIPEGYFVNLEIPNEKRASLLSLNSLVFQIGGLIGSAVSGAAIRFTSIPVLWAIVGGVVLVSSAAIALLRNPNRDTQTV